MTKYKVNVIGYDFDEGDENEGQIPTNLVIEVPDDIEVDEIENFISDEISNQTGYCHHGFTYEK